MSSFLNKCMQSVDGNCVCNTAAALLQVNCILILVCSSPRMLGVSLVMLLGARGAVTTWLLQRR